jgi:lysine 2,3-aminomutase
MDFMGEKSTSPIDCITRRYPQILIIKPFDSCPQICVYCQRNWEMKNIKEGAVTNAKIQKALNWIRKNPNITEVLVTGGDPLALSNDYLNKLMDSISSMPHVERIRLGTRTPVTLPFRIDGGFIKLLKKYHELGKREVCIVTHVEHSSEITPDVLEAVKRIKEAGVNIYNQQVFTYYNSRRFETAALRRTLKISGIDPYYSFNTKGKAETADFRVPIARIEQERKEEARLLPGMVRMDEPVFNVPRLGKSYLRAWQDHEVIMLLPDGRRVYRFYPWESRILLTDTYLYTDVSIYDYLARLQSDGEDIEDYKSIWYYF